MGSQRQRHTAAHDGSHLLALGHRRQLQIRSSRFAGCVVFIPDGSFHMHTGVSNQPGQQHPRFPSVHAPIQEDQEKGARRQDHDGGILLDELQLDTDWHNQRRYPHNETRIENARSHSITQCQPALTAKTRQHTDQQLGCARSISHDGQPD